MGVIRQDELEEEQNAHVRYAVLLIHEGGPRELSLPSVVSFMAERFSQPRLVDSVPRCVWYPILYGFVLPFSYRRVRQLYESSWVVPREPRRPSGSLAITQPGATPAVYYTNLLAQKLADAITSLINSAAADEGSATTPWTRRGSSISQASAGDHHGGTAPALTYSVQVECAYTAQRNSVEDALRRFRLHGNYTGICDTSKRPAMVLDEHLIVVPLYPQYSAIFSGSSLDAVMQSAYFRRSSCYPHMSVVRSYCDHHAYIKTLECMVRAFIATHGEPDLLLVVFDDTPNKYGRAGDSYTVECRRTFMALREALTGPQLATTFGSWVSLPLFNTPLDEATLATGFLHVTTGSGSTGRRDVVDLLKSARTVRELRGDQDTSSLAVSSLTAPVEPVQAGGAHAAPKWSDADVVAASKESGAGTVYFMLPGVTVDTATSIADSRLLCELACENGWRAAKVLPSLNDTSTHVEMLTAVLTSEM